MWVCVLFPDGYKAMRIDNKLSEYQKLVQGYIETVPTGIRGHFLLIDEEGKFRSKKVNPLATQCCTHFLCGRDVIVGNAVLVRLNTDGDDWTGWPSREECVKAFQAVLHAGYSR